MPEFQVTLFDPLPRLYRFRDTAAFKELHPDASDDCVAVLTPEKNLLVINSDLYDALDPASRDVVLKTRDRFTWVQ